MIFDGLTQRAQVMEACYAFEQDRELREKYAAELARHATEEELRQATRISDDDVIAELVDIGLQADSLHLITLVPLIHVAWANGYVERNERQVILKTAEEEEIRPDSAGFALLSGWLKQKPDGELFRTWSDYISALGRILDADTLRALRDTAIRRAEAVAESAGGLFGFHAVSDAEQRAIDQLRGCFSTAGI